MITIASLWLPIVLATLAVFFASSLLHMLLSYHDADYGPLPDEDAALAALRPLNIPPGNYAVPRGARSQMKDPAFLQKMQQGPLLMMHVRPGGSMRMGPMLGSWFVYVLVVAFFTAYLCSRTLATGADYLSVFRVAGFTAFMAYAVGQPMESIWYSRNWSSTLKNIIDGLIYGLLTGGVFGWLWPR
jgi:hypothetical protein